MSQADETGYADWLAPGCIFGAVACELVVREQFHKDSTEIILLLQLAAITVVLVASISYLSMSRKYRRLGSVAGRLSLVLAAVVGASVLESHRLSPLPPDANLPLQLLAYTFGGFLCWKFVTRVKLPQWRRFRSALCAAFILFVASQWIIVALRAPQISWPATEGAEAHQEISSVKTAQIFILFDELNASAAGPIIEVLKRNGIDYRTKSIDTVADSTAKVVPSLFRGGDFRDAKPCGMTSICGSKDVLDFSRIHASRGDVDVVGFYLPYCAIQGLRHCERLELKSPLADWSRWLCAGLRRIAYSPAALVGFCANTHSTTWGELIDATEAAIWRAPIWQQGGYLFAHIPLPHPPGRLPNTSLVTDYRDGVLRAANLVQEIIEQSKKKDIKVLSLVIFSDHPLRIKLWCNSLTYAAHPCTVGDGLIDQKVPLIVAGDFLPAIDGLTINTQIFTVPAIDSHTDIAHPTSSGKN